MRESVPSASFATQTIPPTTAISEGPSPTGIVPTTEFVSGLIRETVSSSVFTTHTASPTTASDPGALPTWIGWVTSFVAGLIRRTWFDPASADPHTLEPDGDPAWVEPDRDLDDNSPAVRIDAGDRSVEPVGHPHVALADRNVRRAVADLDRVSTTSRNSGRC